MLARSEVRIPKQRRALRTRAAIMEAARAEFSQRGYAGATSKTIAERAGHNHTSFVEGTRLATALLGGAGRRAAGPEMRDLV